MLKQCITLNTMNWLKYYDNNHICQYNFAADICQCIRYKKVGAFRQ